MLLCSLFALRRCNHTADAEQVLDFSHCSVLFVTQSLAVMLAVNYWTKTGGGGELVPLVHKGKVRALKQERFCLIVM